MCDPAERKRISGDSGDSTPTSPGWRGSRCYATAPCSPNPAVFGCCRGVCCRSQSQTQRDPHIIWLFLHHFIVLFSHSHHPIHSLEHVSPRRAPPKRAAAAWVGQTHRVQNNSTKDGQLEGTRPLTDSFPQASLRPWLGAIFSQESGLSGGPSGGRATGSPVV